MFPLHDRPASLDAPKIKSAYKTEIKSAYKTEIMYVQSVLYEMVPRKKMFI